MRRLLVGKLLVEARFLLLTLYGGLDAVCVGTRHAAELVYPALVILQRKGAIHDAFDRNLRYIAQPYGLYVLSLPAARDFYVVLVDVDDMVVVSRSLGYKSVQRCSLLLLSGFGHRPGVLTFSSFCWPL